MNELKHLKDIHLPPPISMELSFFLTILLIIFSFSILCYLIYSYCLVLKKKKAVIQHAIQMLTQLENLTLNNPKQIHITAEISILLRRVALHYFPREKIASLSGKEWLEFLNYSGHTTQFSEEMGQLLIESPYCKNNNNNLSKLFIITHQWLKTLSKRKALSVEK